MGHREIATGGMTEETEEVESDDMSWGNWTESGLQQSAAPRTITETTLHFFGSAHKADQASRRLTGFLRYGPASRLHPKP